MANETTKNKKEIEETVVPQNVNEGAETAASASEAVAIAGMAVRASAVDPFANVRRPDGVDDDSTEREGNVTIFKNTETLLYINHRKDPKTKNIWTDLRFCYELEMNDNVSLIIVNVKPVATGEGVYSLINSVYNGEKCKPVDILKTTGTDPKGRKTERYSLRLADKNAAGIPIEISLRPAEGSDRELFNTYVEMLKATGVIS